MTNPFIPKDNYVSRIADKLEKEKMKRVFLHQCGYLGIHPKDMKLYYSENVSKHYIDLSNEAYEEFIKDIDSATKGIEHKLPKMLADMVKLDSENISRMIKKVED